VGLGSGILGTLEESVGWDALTMRLTVLYLLEGHLVKGGLLNSMMYWSLQNQNVC
jgi:hypothetical protein